MGSTSAPEISPKGEETSGKEGLLQLADHRQGLTEELPAFAVLPAVGGEFNRAVTTGHTEHQPTTGELIHAGGGLRDVDRVSQRQHHPGGAQGDAVGDRGQVPQVGEGVEDLPGVAEAGHVQRDVA